MLRTILVLLCLLPLAALANAEVPTEDIAGAGDLPWLKRYEGSYIVSYEQRRFDAISFPASRLLVDDGSDARDAKNNRIAAAKRRVSVEGRYTRLLYIAPEDRSPLEVMRNYIDEIKSSGGKLLYGCRDEGCGGDMVGNDHGGGTQGLLETLYPGKRIKDAYNSTGYCASTRDPAEQRYALATLPDGDGNQRTLAVYVYAFGETYPYCGALEDRTGVLVVAIEPTAREKKMVTVTADEMAQALAAEGKISLYGIHFDFNKSVVRPESAPTLEQIAALLKSQPTLALDVVGHTDNVGGADYNRKLSQRRADAVVTALVEDYAIDDGRLTPSGAGMDKPVADNGSAQGRAKNRRVELVKR